MKPQRYEKIAFAILLLAGALVALALVKPEGLKQATTSMLEMACGTGACATAVAAALTGRASRRSEIRMDGGTLQIEWRSADNHVYMTGPAEIVFDGEIGE